MAMICERCKKDVYKTNTCNYCSRKICDSCIKSQQRLHKTVKLFICKDCWSNMPKRSAFKNRKDTLEVVGNS